MPRARFRAWRMPTGFVELALQGSDFKITFKTDWIDWNDLAVVTFSDASFANEAEYKSQQERIVPQRCEDRWAQISPDRIWVFDFEKGLSSHPTGRSVCLAGINRIWWQDSSFALRVDWTPDFSQGMVSAESASNAALVLHRLPLRQRPSVVWSCTQGARQALRNRTLCTLSSALDQCWENFPEVLPGRWWNWMDRYRQAIGWRSDQKYETWFPYQGTCRRVHQRAEAELRDHGTCTETRIVTYVVQKYQNAEVWYAILANPIGIELHALFCI